MKLVGFTRTDGFLVEMTKEEYQTFQMLQQAAEGTSFPEMMPSKPELNYPFDGVFGAIHAWVRVQFGINRLKDEIQTLAEYMANKVKTS